MPRDIPIGNGSLLVNFDSSYALRDLYWPHVGQENHTIGHPCRLGAWVDGQFSWVNDPGWQRVLDYVHDTLVTMVELQRADWGLKLECNDAVDLHEDLYLRKVVVRNETDREREIRLFFSQDFHISAHEVGDSAYYEPDHSAVVHYKGRRWFLVGAAKQDAGDWTFGVDQWAVGNKEQGCKVGTWRDAEDGELSGNPVAQGSVDSAVAVQLQVAPRGEATVWYWIAVGSDYAEVARLDEMVRERTPSAFLKRTHNYWLLWAETEYEDFASLPHDVYHQYRRSLLILRTQIDNEGAIIAANDWDITRFARDTYSYMWPRDGALVAAALIKAGHSEVTRRFFNLCQRIITPAGYLLHKYNPDGSLASSWHGWYRNGRKELPVQEDETALVLWALWRYFQGMHDVEFIKLLYRGLIVRAANWMNEYRDTNTGLPLPSWDLWEERRGVSAWTIGATCAGLDAAANFSEAFGEGELAARYRQALEEITVAADAHLWVPRQHCFSCMINRQDDSSWRADPRVDASLMGLWYFGMYAPDDPRIVATMETIRDRLWVKTDVGGVARYENDGYHQISQDTENVPGNPWFICTLWLAQWYIAMAKTANDLEPALEILDWATDHALHSGVMAEQVHPYTNEPLSVSPLTWSHATFVLTVHEYLDRFKVISEGT